MATYPLQRFTISLLVLLSLNQAQSSSSSSSSSHPKSIVLPITKDPKTLQYITQIELGTPFLLKRLIVDLGGRYLWMDCEKGYESLSHKPGRCGSTTCSITKPFGFGCTDCKQSPYKDCKNTCSLLPQNTVSGLASFQAVGVDTIEVPFIDGPKYRPNYITVISNFIFSCNQHSFLRDLAKGSKGMAGLGRTKIGLPTQFSSALGGSLPQKFAMCLSSDPKASGLLRFGEIKNYTFYPAYNTSKRIDVSERFTYTKLLINPVSTASIYMDGEKSAEYFIGLKSITVNKKPIFIDLARLTFSKDGYGGTKISTVNPYTALDSAIYETFIEAVVKEFAAINVNRVAPVAPFTACFSTKNMSYEILGPSAPDIEFVLENKNVVWKMYGYNVMVEINRDVVCLGFVDAGPMRRTPIIIGAHQLENNLLEFDLASSRLAFTGTLIFDEVRCENFIL